MALITGRTTQRASGPYWYWTVVKGPAGPALVQLADQQANLPPGTYELSWDFRGNPGDKFAFSLVDEMGSTITAVSDTVVHYDERASKFFQVAA
jgi:hypothetical protein